MNDDLVRRRLRQVLDVEPTDLALRARVMASLPLELGDERPVRRWLAGVLAVVLAGAIVAGLLYARSAREAAPKPAAAPHHESLVPAGSAQVTAVDLRCELPLASRRGGAFLSLPDGQVGLDPTNTVAGLGRPYYVGGRWISAQPALSPDGKAYAYATTEKLPTAPHVTAAIHVVDASSGADRVIWQGDSTIVSLVGFGPDAVYANAYAANAASSSSLRPGMWAFDIKGGPPRRVENAEDGTRYSAVNQTAIWGVVTGTGVRRLDLATGNKTDYQVGVAGPLTISVVGFDTDGSPLLLVVATPKKTTPSLTPIGGLAPATAAPAPSSLYLVTREGDVKLITNDLALTNTSFVSDKHGIWIAGADGSVWLYSQTSGLRKVASIDPGSLGDGVRVAGSCQ